MSTETNTETNEVIEQAPAAAPAAPARPDLGGAILTQIAVNEAGVDVYLRVPSNAQMADGRPVPDKVYRQEYRVTDGKLLELRLVEGVHQPAMLIPEQVYFPGDVPAEGVNKG